MSGADIRQQLAFTIENLKPVLHRIGHPDMTVAIDRYALGPLEVAGTVAVFAELADEVSIGIENLYAIVKGVGHVDIAILIQRHALWRAKVSRGGEEVVFAAGS